MWAIELSCGHQRLHSADPTLTMMTLAQSTQRDRTSIIQFTIANVTDYILKKRDPCQRLHSPDSTLTMMNPAQSTLRVSSQRDCFNVIQFIMFGSVLKNNTTKLLIESHGQDCTFFMILLNIRLNKLV